MDVMRGLEILIARLKLNLWVLLRGCRHSKVILRDARGEILCVKTVTKDGREAKTFYLRDGG
jgi:hypothetical protein